MLGVIVNMLAAVVGGTLGTLFKKGIPEKITNAIMIAVGMCVIYIGIDGALVGENTLVLIISMLVGTAIGSLIDDLKDWRHFIRRSPQEYYNWIQTTSKECEKIELIMLQEICDTDKPIFVDTNISPETLKEISDENHVLIMLADKDISVNLFFNRPDREKQFLYQLLMTEPDPEAAMANFRRGLELINSQEKYD